MESDEELEAMILHKLARRRKWGESHTAFENTAKGVPPHLKGRIKDLTEGLIKKRFILQKPTNYGLQISLNVEKSYEIKAIIHRYFADDIL
jgi:hypothetical protein